MARSSVLVIVSYTVNLLDSFLSDLRYATRQLRQSPGFTLVAILSLALGIGANTAMFQLIDVVRLRTLPIQKPEELAYVDFAPNSWRSGWHSTRNARFTSAQWDQVRTQQQAFSGLAAWSATRFNLAAGGEARYAEGLYVNGDFFNALGVIPLIGRTFTSKDDTEACPGPMAVISYPFWQREFGGDPNILNRTMTLEGRPFSIVGVTPQPFFGVEVGRRFDVATTLCADRVMAEDKKGRAPIRHAWWLGIMGRLKPGWSIGQAKAHLETLSPGIMRATLPEEYRPDAVKKYLVNKLEVTPGETGISGLRRQYERPLWLLMAITGLVLLIACANLANLLLARASIREREVAVRLALGASRGKLIGQLLTESLLLAMIGAAAGVALAQLLSKGLVLFLTTENAPLFLGMGMDLRILGFTALLAVTTCVLFGLAPALRTTHIAPVTVLRAGGRSVTAGKERFGLRRALVVTQVALSLVLLVGALLFVRSLQKLMAVDTGFQAEGILQVDLNLSRQKYEKERYQAIHRELMDRLTTKPGVASIAQVNFTPVSGSGWDGTVRTVAGGEGKPSNFNLASEGYFRTMGIPILSGRDFNNHDTMSSPKVAAINQVFAEKVFGNTNPIGRTFLMESGAGKPDRLYEVVALVKNTKYYELREDSTPIAFFPPTQDENVGSGVTFVIRTNGSVGSVINNVKAATAEVNPAIGIEFRILSQQLQNSLLRESLMAMLSSGFGLLAGLLATLGLYGVISYMVAKRRNEIGVRIALGADRGRVIRLVLREAGLLLGIGLIVGALLALWAGRAASTLLYGLQPYDPITLGVAIVLLAGIALLASYGPAHRAASMEPMAALREE